MQQEFYSNGKLLLSGEYAILDGAKGLAVPTKFGQSLLVHSTDETIISWNSYDADGTTWFSTKLDLKDLNIIDTTDIETTKTLQSILLAAKKANPEFLAIKHGIGVTTKLTFPRKWGLGTSSTLINNIAQWASVDAHQLLWNSFGGSGYDISCAQRNSPILYHIKNKQPQVESVEFNPSFKDAIYFVYLNQKQSSKRAIANYRSKQFNLEGLIAEIDTISLEMISATELIEFDALLVKHEQLLSKILEIEPVKEKLFPDYFGAIKSLGGWGGDFIMVTGNEKTPEYFISKGFDTVIPFKEMVL
jgi:mevalonate kinase